jgi:Major Facilitator Superfamily
MDGSGKLNADRWNSLSAIAFYPSAFPQGPHPTPRGHHDPAHAHAFRPVSISTWTGFGVVHGDPRREVVATSLPTIQKALGIAQDQMSWIQTAYLIAEIVAIPLTGFLTRTLTMRWLFVIAVSIFTLASIVCAASDSFGALILWRVIQGFSGDTLIPTVLSAVFLLFPFPASDLRPPSRASWRCWRRPPDRWWAAGSPRPSPGVGCS